MRMPAKASRTLSQSSASVLQTSQVRSAALTPKRSNLLSDDLLTDKQLLFMGFGAGLKKPAVPFFNQINEQPIAPRLGKRRQQQDHLPAFTRRHYALEQAGPAFDGHLFFFLEDQESQVHARIRESF